MEIISRISKGSKMDQIYISKNRFGLNIGAYVTVKPLETPKENIKNLYFRKANDLEPIKIEIIKKIFQMIDKHSKKLENIIITGSFLEKGFKFRDIDVII